MSVEKLVEHFSALEDPRCVGKVEHRLIDILVIAVCAVIACAESWDDIALYGRNKLNWLQSFLTLANGIPSHDTFRRVFMLIDPDAFEGSVSFRGKNTRCGASSILLTYKLLCFAPKADRTPLRAAAAPRYTLTNSSSVASAAQCGGGERH